MLIFGYYFLSILNIEDTSFDLPSLLPMLDSIS